ncbi:SpoIIE family protein phosphatase [Streptomyces sp. CNQ085]|uniref:SpoIIE family protein phosphatase n=1 Tax=Streptomyces sp. CNQ085 TaxID=2886944 RepID=UPI0027E4B648|nr:SpoIIE family protein phosphatase [Streptomyces sp. CNQ085]
MERRAWTTTGSLRRRTSSITGTGTSGTLRPFPSAEDRHRLSSQRPACGVPLPHRRGGGGGAPPPPLLVAPGGPPRFLEPGHGPLLGMSATLDLGLHWPDAYEELPPEATVVFYTDGLVESRGRPIDTGMDLLRHHASALARHDLEEFCDELPERMDPRGDDVAPPALRLPRYGEGSPGDRTPPPSRGEPAHSPADPSRSAPGAEALDAEEIFTQAPRGTDRPPLP